MHKPSAVTRYDPTTIWLHWITVGLIVALWLIGQTGHWFPRGPFRTGIWSIHVTLGFATAFVLLGERISGASFRPPTLAFCTS